MEGRAGKSGDSMPTGKDEGEEGVWDELEVHRGLGNQVDGMVF